MVRRRRGRGSSGPDHNVDSPTVRAINDPSAARSVSADRISVSVNVVHRRRSFSLAGPWPMKNRRVSSRTASGRSRTGEGGATSSTKP